MASFRVASPVGVTALPVAIWAIGEWVVVAVCNAAGYRNQGSEGECEQEQGFLHAGFDGVDGRNIHNK